MQETLTEEMCPQPDLFGRSIPPQSEAYDDSSAEYELSDHTSELGQSALSASELDAQLI